MITICNVVLKTKTAQRAFQEVTNNAKEGNTARNIASSNTDNYKNTVAAISEDTLKLT